MPKKKSAPKDEKSPEASTTSAPDRLTGPSPVSTHLPSSPETAALGSGANASLQELVEKNIKWSQVIYEQNRRIKRRLGWMVFGNYLRLFLLLAPIILGIIYLPEILDSFFTQYEALFTRPGGGINPELLREMLDLFGQQ